jgi:S1-C subfamily serine protease
MRCVMRKINFLKLIAVLIILPACASTSTTGQRSTPASVPNVTIPVIGMFDDYNEVFKGVIVDTGYGNGIIEMKSYPSGLTCKGHSYPTQLPTGPNCKGLEGRAHLICSDGRKVDAVWKATACGKGVSKGIDQKGNQLSFVYGMTESEAMGYINQLAKAVAHKPSLPPVYKPKETRKERGFATGTGFFVSNNGYMITNYHVIEGSKEIAIVRRDGSILNAKFIKGDPLNDVALIKVNAITKPLRFSDKVSLSKGEEVFTLGYPLLALQGQEQKATFGRVNALSGIKGDIRYCQIDIPVQPGNSGGPLLDKNGNVVGVVTATLNEYVTLRASGHLPQNVNYAVKSDYIIPLVRDSLTEGMEFTGSKPSKKDLPELIKSLEPSVALVVSR